MEVAFRASAIGFSAASFECVDGTGQQGLSFHESLLELLDVLAEAEQLSSEGTEALGHGDSPRADGEAIRYCILLYISTYRFQAAKQKNFPGAKNSVSGLERGLTEGELS
jgi:hypothetical protein